MNIEFYQSLEKLLFEECKTNIKKFIKSENNKNVYVFAIECDPEDTGICNICINTLDGFKEVLSKYYKDYSNEDLYGITGVKYNTGDFIFRIKLENQELRKMFNDYARFIQSLDIDLEKDLKVYNIQYELLLSSAVSVVNNLSNDLYSLNQTDDFITFVTTYDITEEEQENLYRLTVPENKIELLFRYIK